MSEVYRTAITVRAPPERVWEHFVRPELLVRWMGDHARLEAVEGGVFSVDINGVLIRGHFARLEHPRLLEVAWGEAGNAAMPPGTTRLVVRLVPVEGGTRVELEHHGLVPSEGAKHAVGWVHFVARLGVLAGGGDPGPDPWASAPPTAAS
ncbi:MAG: SRPBCC domain-containing protein [Deltaproteobacteria bacterium]|nr:SRPBCC domain-containing protein [Deltaproteobacteria bacterium]